MTGSPGPGAQGYRLGGFCRREWWVRSPLRSAARELRSSWLHWPPLVISWVRQDAILWPLMFVSLAVALWGLTRDRRRHAISGPFAMASVGSAGLVAGVVFVHGPPAMWLINAVFLLLIAATLWNIWMRKSGATRSG